MIQSSSANTVYASIAEDISKSFLLFLMKKRTIPKEESELVSEYYVGCDESSAVGESFGSIEVMRISRNQ